MNYFKKIKSIGFKKIDRIVAVGYDYLSSIDGFYIINLNEYLKNNTYGHHGCIPSELILDPTKYHCFEYKLSYDISLYLLIIRDKFNLIVKDDSLENYYPKLTFGNATKQKSDKIKFTIHNEILDELFWKKILSKLDKKILREINIKNILN